MIVYSIPAAALADFPARPVVLRTADPSEACAVLGPEIPEGVAFVQLTDLKADMTPLVAWGEGLPLDLVMSDPRAELPLLYRCTGLLERHPVRVSVPWRPGLARAVKLAVSLGFAARLTGHRPSPESLAEARQALEHFLHNPTVAHPVEPFQGLLIGLLHNEPVRLWSLLERDPAEIRILDDRGQESEDRGPTSVIAFRDALLEAGAECVGCEWRPVCEGYFKWPDADYDCIGVKALLADLRAAATELEAELAAYGKREG